MDRPRWRADVPVPPLERTQYRRGYLGAKIRRSAQIGLTVGRPDVSNPATPGSLSTEGQNPAAPSLLGLPPELRLQIFELMSRDRASTEIPARRALVGPRSKEYPFSHFFHRRKTTAQNSRPYHIALQPTALNLILACQQLRTELCNFIGLNCVYRRRETSDVLQLPQPGWFGRVSCSIFRYLELNSEPDLRYRQRTWPKYLRLLSEDLPNLIYLKLYSTWVSEEHGWSPLSGDALTLAACANYAREVQYKLRFMAFLCTAAPEFASTRPHSSKWSDLGKQ